MKPSPECFPCFLQQTLLACRQGRADPRTQMKALTESSRLLPSFDVTRDNPPFIATKLMEKTYRVLKSADPYRAVKDEYNRKVKKLYPELSRRMRGSREPLVTAVQLALAGNIIDFGILESFDLEATLDATLAIRLPRQRIDSLRGRIVRARHILYIADNAGEIGFDRFLLEEVRKLNARAEITLAVKRRPVINDATRDDARYFGLDKKVRLIDTGNGWIGTHPESSGAVFRAAFGGADLIISKGQANWESMEGRRDPRVAFLLKAKCPVVARALGVALQAPVLTLQDR